MGPLDAGCLSIVNAAPFATPNFLSRLADLPSTPSKEDPERAKSPRHRDMQ